MVHVAVIGGGAAGLACAQKLTSNGIQDVVVLEASDRVGGRIRQSDSIWPGHVVDLGAEFVHGDKTSLYRMARDKRCGMEEMFTWAQGDGGPSDASPTGGIGYYYLGDQQRLLRYDSDDEEFNKLNKLLWTLPDQEIDWDTPSSLLDFLKRNHVSDSMIALAEAGYANTAGSHADQLSLPATCHFEHIWDVDGEGDFHLKDSMKIVVDALQVDCPVQLKNPVTKIAIDASDEIVITTECNNVIHAAKVVVTVPLTQLPNIEFDPPLSQQKRKAMYSFGMSGAVKIFVRFRSIFWPPKCQGVVCSESLVPEFWMHPDNNYVSNNDYLITETQCIKEFVSQLDDIFGTNVCPHPASSNFIDGSRFDWKAEKFIQGGYSYPRVGISKDAAQILEAPIQNSIYFAGEGISGKLPGMTVHSAIDSGHRAANKIIESHHST